MSEALYNLAIIQHSSGKSIDKLVQDLLEIMEETGDAYLEYKLSESLLFKESTSAILENITLAEGEHYRQLFLEQKVETRLYPALQLVAKADEVKDDETYNCPACQYQQTKSKENADVCEKCGVAGAKYNQKIKKQQKRKDIYEAEKRKLELAQKESLKVAKIQADHNETESLREDARNKLGIKKKKQTAIAVASIAAMLITGFVSYSIYQELSKNTEQEANLIAETTPQSSPEEAASGTSGNHTQEQELTGTSDNNTPKQKLASTSGNHTEEQELIGTSGNKTPTGKGISTASALQAIQKLTGNQNNDAHIGIQGKDTPLSQAQNQATLIEAELNNTKTKQEIVITTKLSIQQLEGLKAILKSKEAKTFGHNASGQYTENLPKLKRLLELDKPDLGLIFAESVSDPYSAALLILEVANSKQQNLLHNDILLTMKSIAVKSTSEQIAPLLTSVLSQVYTITGDTATAETLQGKAITEAENTADTPEQNIQWLTRMLIDHEHFNHSAGAEKLTDKLESIAGNTPADTPEGQLTISSIYTHLAAISLNHGDIADATTWLKKIPVESTREHLQTYLHNI